MSLSILIDMNLSNEWADHLQQAGYSAIHWSAVGPPDAADSDIMAWAREHDHIVFTHDLDFGTALALTHAAGPSVIQLRGTRVLPEQSLELMKSCLVQYAQVLRSGALIVIDESRSRVRILPL